MEGGERVLTARDLLFIDLDIDTKPEDIKFESRATPNGRFGSLPYISHHIGIISHHIVHHGYLSNPRI